MQRSHATRGGKHALQSSLATRQPDRHHVGRCWVIPVERRCVHGPGFRTAAFPRRCRCPVSSPTLTQRSPWFSSFTAAVPMSAIFGPGLLYAMARPRARLRTDSRSRSLRPLAAKVWTMTLHSKMKFSDGTPFNAASVCADIARLANPATGSALRLVPGSADRVPGAQRDGGEVHAENSKFLLSECDFAGLPVHPFADGDRE